MSGGQFAENDGPGPCPPEVRCPDRTLCPLSCIEAGSREDPNHRPVLAGDEWDALADAWEDAERASDLRPAVERIVVSREAAARAEAIETVAREWQFGGWTILNTPPPSGSIPSLALGQKVTDWLRERVIRPALPPQAGDE